MESFWGLLKNEVVHLRRFKTRAEAFQPITEYIGYFTNNNAYRLGWAAYHRPLHLNASYTKRLTA